MDDPHMSFYDVQAPANSHFIAGSTTVSIIGTKAYRSPFEFKPFEVPSIVAELYPDIGLFCAAG